MSRIVTEFLVHLHSFRGVDLKAVDKNGTSDPYLKINFDELKKFTTPYVKKELSPVWDFNERFTYETSFANKLALKTMTLEIFDFNKVKTAKHLGRVEVDLMTLAMGPVFHDLPVIDADGMNSGRVQFCVEMLQIENVTVVLKDIIVLGLSVPEGPLRPQLSYCFSDSRDRSVTTEVYSEDGDKPAWLRPPRLAFKASLAQLLSNSLIISVLNKKAIDLENDREYSEKIAHFELRFQKYHSFESLTELSFREKALPPIPPHDSFPALDASISGKMVIVKFPTHAQMVKGVHNETGIINAKKFLEKCPIPDCKVTFLDKSGDLTSKMSNMNLGVQPGAPVVTGTREGEWYEKKAPPPGVPSMLGKLGPPGAFAPGAPGAFAPGAPGAFVPGAPGAFAPGAPGAFAPGAPGAFAPGAPGAFAPGAPGVLGAPSAFGGHGAPPNFSPGMSSTAPPGMPSSTNTMSTFPGAQKPTSSMGYVPPGPGIGAPMGYAPPGSAPMSGVPRQTSYPMTGQSSMQMGSPMVPTEQTYPPLPVGWAESTDPRTGRKFYKHHRTKTTQWNRPVAPVSLSTPNSVYSQPQRQPVVPVVPGTGMQSSSYVPYGGQAPVQQFQPSVAPVRAPIPQVAPKVIAPGVPQTGLPLGWEACLDKKTGRVYYKNHGTKQTQWHKPVAPQSGRTGQPVAYGQMAPMGGMQPMGVQQPVRQQFGVQPAPVRQQFGVQPVPVRQQFGVQPAPVRQQFAQPQPQIIQPRVYQQQAVAPVAYGHPQPRPQSNLYGSQPAPQQATYPPQRPHWSS